DSTIQLFGQLIRGGARLTVQQMLRTADRLPRQPMAAWEREIARCLSQAAVVDYFELRLWGAFSHTIAAAAHAERAGPSVEVALASAQLACALGILDQPRAS